MGTMAKVRKQINDEGALPVIPLRSNASKKAYGPKRFYQWQAQNRVLLVQDWRRSAPRYDTSREISLPPPPSSEHSTGSSWESRPF